MKSENNLVVVKSEYSHQINGSDTVNRMDLGKYSKITFVSNPNKTSSIRKLSKYEYVDTRTGEIKKYKLDNPTSKSDVNRKLKRYEEIVIFNFTGGASELFLTLTCRESITDISVIKQYYNDFLENIKSDYQYLEYVALFEQTENLCWHIHLFLKNNNHTKVSNKTYKVRNKENDKVVNTIVTEMYKQTKTDKV